MSWNNIIQTIVYLVVLILMVKPLGIYMAHVYEGEPAGLNIWLASIERLIYRLSGVKPEKGMSWKAYATAMMLFNIIGIIVVYILQRLQAHLPLNPNSMPAVAPDLAFNTAMSFATNTNWQNYSGETTLSYFTQMLGLTVQNFVSAATGMAILVALIRGFVQKQVETVGNFWVDLVRSILYILLPLSLILSLILVSQGVVQTFRPGENVSLLQATKDADGKVVSEQTLALGPAASQVAIKQLGTNGGGFFNVNSSHPFENPTPLSNFLEVISILLIPAALCYTFGYMVRDRRQGWALLAAAGVGKTYTMLEAARLRKQEGVDIVVGYVDTHKRAETEALLEGLEVLPPKVIKYKNVELREFDIDAALARNPKLILVDELAHSNAPGSRHLKRWQDIEELLDKGIDVYTTLNVQHCESANDIVTQVTGIIVRETVPDTFVENADEIELVDLPTEDLLNRLKEGKVYLGEQAELAAQNFFQPGNLIALRQLALRYTERNVDAELMLYKQIHSISKVWNVRDRFLVCISPSPYAINLIRAGKRIASDLGVEWIVAYVETHSPLHQEDKNRISEMMRFAEKLGAQVVTLSGQEIADTLISYARSKNITKIIVGKPVKPRWHELIFGTIIDKLARKCGEIDLYIVSGDSQEQHIRPKTVVLKSFSWRDFIWTIGIVAFCTIVDRIIFSHLDPVNSIVNLIMVYLLGVTWVAFRYGRRMSIIASLLSVLAFDFFYVPPYYTMVVSDIQYVITFLVMLIVGITIGHLTGQLRRQIIAMRLREDRTQGLYAISRDLSRSFSPDELFKIALGHIQEVFKCNAVIFTPDENGKIVVRFGNIKELGLTLNEQAVAQWAYENGKTAGKGTDTLPGSKGIYLPLVGLEKTVGVIGILTNDDRQFVDPDQFHMLEMVIHQTALAVERAQLAAVALDAKSIIQNEYVKNMLLTTLSSELSGPLTAISETASELLKPESINDKSRYTELIQEMRREVERLNSLFVELPKVLELVRY